MGPPSMVARLVLGAGVTGRPLGGLVIGGGDGGAGIGAAVNGGEVLGAGVTGRWVGGLVVGGGVGGGVHFCGHTLSITVLEPAQSVQLTHTPCGLLSERVRLLSQ